VITEREVLQNARDWLAKHNWQQYGYGDGDSCCVIGAIAFANSGVFAVAPDDGRLCLAHDWCLMNACRDGIVEPASVLRGVIDRRCDGQLARWNDKLGRTKEEVLALLDEAIALTEASSKSG
jgi:hypothetical protein